MTDSTNHSQTRIESVKKLDSGVQFFDTFIFAQNTKYLINKHITTLARYLHYE